MAPATTSRSSQSLDTSAERRAFIPSPVPTEDGPTTVQNKPSALQNSSNATKFLTALDDPVPTSKFFGLFGLLFPPLHVSFGRNGLTFLAPTVTAAFGFLFLREAVSWKQAVAGLASLAGVVLIAKPTSLFGGSDRADTGAGAGGPVVTSRTHGRCWRGYARRSWCFSCIYLPSSHWKAGSSHAHDVVLLGLVCAGLGGRRNRDAWAMGLPRQWTWIGMLIIVGLFGFLAQLFLTLGLQRETASRGSMVLYIQIVFSLIFERIAFGVSPSGLTEQTFKENRDPANTRVYCYVEPGRCRGSKRLLDGDEQKEEIEIERQRMFPINPRWIKNQNKSTLANISGQLVEAALRRLAHDTNYRTGAPGRVWLSVGYCGPRTPDYGTPDCDSKYTWDNDKLCCQPKRY
ncbi:integral membrane family protein [Rhizoctonia solani]|uniref:Integral membrane family protein n=1 Tax=Rhizoctonia solani TaxID=456999 RepID=A0A8H8P311_9AGAM|nr:integral membrane family protein [Rhizoctonia solani]QRW22727.1 integral membrane family protein [Rhizoctonia solani]